MVRTARGYGSQREHLLMRNYLLLRDKSGIADITAYQREEPIEAELAGSEPCDPSSIFPSPASSVQRLLSIFYYYHLFRLNFARDESQRSFGEPRRVFDDGSGIVCRRLFARFHREIQENIQQKVAKNINIILSDVGADLLP